jgi:hypothetical protein
MSKTASSIENGLLIGGEVIKTGSEELNSVA